MTCRRLPSARFTSAGIVLWASIGIACGGGTVHPPIDSDQDVFGAELPSDEEYAGYFKALPAGVLTGKTSIPDQFQIPASSLPPVQAQGIPQQPGSPGSCEVWSAGYALGSYTANITNQKPISDLNNTVSAAFLYMWVLNQIGKPCGVGTSPATSLNYLVTQTAASLATVPYQPDCSGYLDKIDIKQTYATDLSIGSWSSLPNSAAPGVKLETIKGVVAGSGIVQTTIVVPLGFSKYDPRANSGVFNALASCPASAPACHQHGAIACGGSTKTKSGCAQHGVAIVGYDDTRQNPQTGQPGAVLIMNSFGPNWGANGFMWMSYATFEAILLGGGIVAEPPPAKGLGPALTEVFQRVERRADTALAAHLVFRARIDSPILSSEVTVTAPDGRAATQQLTHPFRSGYLYLTRRDGRSFVPGQYTIRLRGKRVNGESLDVTLQGLVASGPSDLPAAPFPDRMTGTTGQPIR